MNPWELYAILHVVFTETEITVHLHQKLYLGIAWVVSQDRGLDLGEKA